MKKGLLLIALWLSAGSFAYAQQTHDHDHAHKQNEVGLSLGAAYGIEHKEWAPVIHAHYFRGFTPHSRWAFGAGVEYIPGDEQHVEIGAGVRFQPLNKVQLSLMPGISITDKTRFSVHAEAVYEVLHFGNFHLGPIVGYAWTTAHSHLSAGVHVAIAFK